MLSQGRPRPWLQDCLGLIIATKDNASGSSKYAWKRWLRLDHQAEGGLTTKVIRLTVISPYTRHWIDPPNVGSLPTSIYSVASDKVDPGVGGSQLHSTCDCNLRYELRVTALGSRTFHGGGLYPLEDKPGNAPYFTFKDVHLPTGWC